MQQFMPMASRGAKCFDHVGCVNVFDGRGGRCANVSGPCATGWR
jgi:hypothetical protein